MCRFPESLDGHDSGCVASVGIKGTLIIRAAWACSVCLASRVPLSAFARRVACGAGDAHASDRPDFF
jgi:hypothetical protein